MKTLTDTRNELKELIPQGIDIAIRGIKAVIAEGTDKYNDLILIEGRYQHMTRQLIQGIVNDEASQVEFNKIRKDLLAFIDGLEATHLTASAGKGSDGRPDIYNGEVFYRIPNEMQKEVETKCLVRLAFDRKIIMENLEKADGDVLKDIRISEVMGVELLDPVGKAFEIRTLHDTVQFVEKDLYTEWVFYVKPILEGLHNLILKISIIEIKNGIERKRNVVLEEKVEITANMPEKRELAETFATAGIALTVGWVQDRMVGLEELPQPAPKAMDMVRPAPKPASVPRRSSRPLYRKIAPVLSVLVVLLVATLAIRENSSPERKPFVPGDDPAPAMGVDDRPLVFKWSDPTPITRPTFDSLKQVYINKLSKGQLLIITGWYYEDEVAPEDFDNVGEARAAMVKALFIPPIDAKEIVEDSRLIVPEPDGIRGDTLFEGVKFGIVNKVY